MATARVKSVFVELQTQDSSGRRSRNLFISATQYRAQLVFDNLSRFPNDVEADVEIAGSSLAFSGSPLSAIWTTALPLSPKKASEEVHDLEALGVPQPSHERLELTRISVTDVRGATITIDRSSGQAGFPATHDVRIIP